jgi:hypothetical protein
MTGKLFNDILSLRSAMVASLRVVLAFPKKGGTSMAKVISNIVLVLAIIYIAPFLVYALASVIAGVKPPEGVSPAQFLISVLVSKIGTAIAFVLIFYFARSSLSGQWLLYAFVWWLMFVIGEIGQAIGPNYTWKEAIAGIISETVYLPLSAYLTNWLIGLK